MVEKKEEKKVKGIRVTEDTTNKLNELIKLSGREPGKEDAEWFEDIINQIYTRQMVLDNDGISPVLRKHFSSDVSALKDAMTSITSLFNSQMNRIAVEKNNWNEVLENTKKEYDGIINGKNEEIKNLQQDVQALQQQLEEQNNTIIQQQNKISGFDKLEGQLRKEIQGLEDTKTKNDDEIERLRDEIVEIKNDHKEEKDKLNQQVVDLLKQLKNVEPIQKEKEVLQAKVKELETALVNKNREYEVNLTRTTEQAETEKERALLNRERELRDQLHEQYRNDTKELYEKIEHLQSEIQALRIENARLKPNHE